MFDQQYGELGPFHEEWHPVGSDYYARHHLYYMEWSSRGPRSISDVNLEHLRVFSSPFGGPIALCRDDSKVILTLSAPTHPDVQLFSPSGALLGRIPWTGGRLMAANWTLEEELLLVDDRGQVGCFTALGLPAREAFSLGAALESEGLIEAVISSNSIVARSANGSIWCVADAKEPKLQSWPRPVTRGVIHCMVPVPEGLSGSGILEILVSVEHTIDILDADNAVTTAVSEGPFVRLAVSPDQCFVAGYSADDVVYIWSASFEDTIVRVAVSDTADDMIDALGMDPRRGGEPTGPPDAWVWCGNDGVLASWDGVGTLLVTRDSGSWSWWDFGQSGSVSVVGEVDGARIVSSERHVLVRRVPKDLVSVLELGSTTPGALLYDARKLYDVRDARAASELMEVLRGGELPNAVASCLGAAAAELDPSKQELLMRAACYGRAFEALDTTTATGTSGEKGRTTMIAMARTLRVLNALRSSSVGLPLTMPQFEALGPTRVLSRLTARRQYAVALAAASAMSVSLEQVLVRWACDKIAVRSGSLSDDDIVVSLLNKLEGRPPGEVGWAEMSAVARAHGRTRLAGLLIEREVRAVKQVPVLLDVGNDEKALRVAVQAGDPDLIFQVIFSMWRSLERSARSPGSVDAHTRFWAVIGAYPEATALWFAYLEKQDPETALALRESTSNEAAAAAGHVALALAPGCPAAKALREYTYGRDLYARAEKSGREDARFEGASAAAAARLLEVQVDLEKSSGRDGFVGLSVIETVRHCLRLGMRDAAQRVVKEFKVPEKQQMLVAIDVAASSSDWSALRQMAARLDRRAPVSMEHFVRIGRVHGAPQATLRWFIDRIAGDGALQRRSQLYAEIGLHQEAAMIAEQIELGVGGPGVLGSLREAVGGTVGSLIGRVS